MSVILRPAGLRRVVLLGAHPDDIEIGAGGLLLALGAVPGVEVHYVLLTGTPQRLAEARDAARAFLPGNRITFALHDLPDGHLPAHWPAVKGAIEAAAALGPADLVVAPWRHDAHQDHRLVAELAPTAFRGPVLLHYEIPKWDGDLGRPNTYLPMTAEAIREKVSLLNTCYPSQKGRDWWDDETFLGLARIRGIECRARYAEAYHCSKALIGL